MTTAVVVNGNARQASALTGLCSDNTELYFSIICAGGYAEGNNADWPSVPLNIDSQSAGFKFWIAESMWFYRDFGTPSYTWLELGDTAGGGNVQGHLGEYARMWYWTDGTQGQCCPTYWFITYAPSDGASREWEIQWETAEALWALKVGGTRYVSVNYFPSPSTHNGQRLFQGMEINRGPFTLSSDMNSGLFTVRNVLRRDCCTWMSWANPQLQVDAPCGIAPGCLQGWWISTPRDWNNAKPAQ